MRLLAVLSPVLVSSAVLASQPGEPIDCSDFVALEPQYNCQRYTPVGASLDIWAERGANKATDNHGRLLMVRRVQYDQINWLAVIALTPGSGVETTLGYFPNIRTQASGCNDNIDPIPGSLSESSNPVLQAPLTFDAVNGRLLVGLDSHQSGCNRCSYDPFRPCSLPNNCGTWGDCVEAWRYPGSSTTRWVAAIDGFATLFEVLESYRPDSGDFGYATPWKPDGLPAADRFDTYWGHVARPLDLSQAHPLQCAYPDHQPQAGEYLSYPDAAPTPAPGQAVYYITSVSYQGRTRAGRQAIDGTLRGRDASALPACWIAR